MRKASWLAKWRIAAGKPMLYDVHSRVVDLRALSYGLLDNHFHILLEVPPMAEG